MKMPAGFCLLIVCALGAEVLAHGGSYRGPPGGVPPGLRVPAGLVSAGLACDCARPDCSQCSHDQLMGGERLTRSEIVQRTTRRWNDFAALRITATFRGRTGGAVEAYALLEPSALFAATAGSILQGDSLLSSSLRTSKDARRRYLWAKQRKLDPLLVMRRDPGRYHLRAFPVRNDRDTIVMIQGFALAAPQERGAPRLYRTGDRLLVVRDTRVGRPLEEGEWADADGKRALSFHGLAAARRRYGKSVELAVEVRFVPALETALTGRGDAAASNEVVLVALEAGAELPPRVGAPEPPPPPPPPPSEAGAESPPRVGALELATKAPLPPPPPPT